MKMCVSIFENRHRLPVMYLFVESEMNKTLDESDVLDLNLNFCFKHRQKEINSKIWDLRLDASREYWCLLII